MEIYNMLPIGYFGITLVVIGCVVGIFGLIRITFITLIKKFFYLKNYINKFDFQKKSYL